jgi:hypothetical protein
MPRMDQEAMDDHCHAVVEVFSTYQSLTVTSPEDKNQGGARGRQVVQHPEHIII